MGGLVWENAKWQQIGHVFFFSFCIAPHSQVGQLMCHLLFMQFFFWFFTKTIGPNNNSWCCNHTISYPWMFNKGIKLWQNSSLPTFTFVQIFHLSICTFPILSTHKFKSKKSSNPSILVYLIQHPLIFGLFFLASLGLASINVFGVGYIDRKMFKSLCQIH